MANRNKHLLITTGIVLLLIAATCSLRTLTRSNSSAFPGWAAATMLWHLIPCGLLMAWCVSISKRILQNTVRRYLLTAGLLMLLWMVVRTVKWEFYLGQCRAVRMCWYAFYIPIVLLPLMGVFVANYVGRPEGYEMPKKLNLLHIPAVVLIGLVFTNDLHQQVFCFPGGLAHFDEEYTYRWGYFVIMTWVVLLVCYFIVSLLRKSRTPGRHWRKKLPLLVMACAAVFWALYCLKLVPHSDMVLINCIIIVALLESCIHSGLIRSNTGYGDLLENSTVAAQITDRDYQVCYASKRAGFLSVEQMRAAEDAPLQLGQTRLSSAPIAGGHVLWLDDVSQIIQLMDQLRETGARLTQEGALLRAEIALREKQARIHEQSRLYDRINQEVSRQLTALDALLNQAEDTPEAQRKKLAQICVISAYIKRRSNLLLLSETVQRPDARELEYCLRESTDNLRLCGAACLADCRCQGTAAAAHLVAVYDLFEQILEPVMLDLTALLVQLQAEAGYLRLRLQLDSALEIPLPDTTALHALGGTLTHTVQAHTVYIELNLPEGGGQV